MEGGAGVSLTLDCEDMFKEITKKLYGEEATVAVGVVGVEFPAAERDLDDDLRPEEHITAWGLAALMQNGFPPPGILQASPQFTLFFAMQYSIVQAQQYTSERVCAGELYAANGSDGGGPVDGGGGAASVGALARGLVQPRPATVQVRRVRVRGLPGARGRALAGDALAGARLPVPAGGLRLRGVVGAQRARAPSARPPLRPCRRRPPAARQPCAS